MRIALGFVLFMPVFAQDPPAPQVRELIEQLHSEKIQDRNEAERRLKALGAAALTELHTAAKDKDPEVAARATLLIRVIELRAKLTPNLLKLKPGLEDRLATSEPSTWTELFLELSKQVKGGDFRREDLLPLAAMAVRGARDNDQRVAVCKEVASQHLRSARAELLPLLSDPEGEVRCYAAQALGEIRALEAGPELLKLLLRTPARFYSVRERAIQALGLLGAKEAAPTIAKLLTEHPLDWRGEAAQALGRLGAREAVPQIADLCDSNDASITAWERQSAIHALGQLGAKEAVPQIVNRLQDKNGEVRGEAVRVLGRLGARQAVPEIVPLLGDGDAGVAREALRVLEELGATEGVPKLVKALKSPSPPVREAALGLLGKSKAREAVPEMTKLLTDDVSEVRREAALALASAGAKEALPQIIKLLEDGNGMVRSDALRSMGALGASLPDAQVLRLLMDDNIFVREAAVSTLGQFHATGLIPGILELLKHQDGRIRDTALYALVELGAKEALPEVIRRLREVKGEWTAFILLSRLDPKLVVPEVLKLLKDPAFLLDLFMEEALEGARTKEEVVPDLLELLKSDKSSRRTLAVRVLANVGAREAVPEIRKLAEDRDPGVRLAVKSALRTLVDRPSPAADPVRADDLLDRLYDSSSSERVRAARSLCGIGQADGVALLLEEGHGSLTILNNLARPDRWRRFDAKVLNEDFRGTRREILGRIGREEGVKLLIGTEDRRLDGVRTVFSGQRWGEVLEAALEGTDCEAILDGEGIRIIPRTEAQKYWHDWFNIDDKRFESRE